MQKPQKIDISETNCAFLGTELEKNVKYDASQKEPAWDGIGKEEGIRIWRIENFKVIPWPKEHYGSFFFGDSYIVLHTYKKSPDAKALSFDVYFWLGKETTQDEAGTAAYKTVELDDYLRGVPIQHREVDGHESALFLSLFPKFTTMDGGVESGFRHVKPTEYRARLLHVKGNKNNVLVREVPMTTDSLNSGDVFILDNGLKLYQFNGNKANMHEKRKAQEQAQAIATERKGLPKVEIVDDEGKDNGSEFWTLLGGFATIKGAAEGGDDDASKFEKKLYRLSDASGKMEFKLEASGSIKKSMFDTNDVFVLDTGVEVIAWVGRHASKDEKKKAILFAQDYITQNKRPAYLPISRMLEGQENESFKSAVPN